MGLCACGFRRLYTKWQPKNSSHWLNHLCIVDSGSSALIVTRAEARQPGITGFNHDHWIKAIFPPNPNPVDMPVGIIDPIEEESMIGNRNACPISTITQRVKVVITKDYTILISLADPTQVTTYDCKNNKIIQNDILSGKWWPQPIEDFRILVA